MNHDELIHSYDVAMTAMHQEIDTLKAMAAKRDVEIAKLKEKVKELEEGDEYICPSRRMFNGNPD